MKRKYLAVGIILLCLSMSTVLTSASPSSQKYSSTLDTLKGIQNGTKDGSRGIYVTLHGTKGENGWYISPVSLIVTADNGTQIIRIECRINGGSWIQYTTPFIFTTDGWIWLDVRVLDQYGTWWYFSFSFGIDTSPPTIELQKEKMSLNKIKIIANVADGISGVWRVEFYLDDELQVTDDEYPFEWIWVGSGNHTVTGKVFDCAGHSANSSMSISCTQRWSQNIFNIQQFHHFIRSLKDRHHMMEDNQ